MHAIEKKYHHTEFPCIHRSNERGAAYVLALVAMLTGLILAFALLRSASANYLSQSSRNAKDAAKYISEAGIEYASWQIAQNQRPVPYTADLALNGGSFHVTVVDDNAREAGAFLVTSTGTARDSSFTTKRIIPGQQEIIIDNPQGTTTGTWSTGTMSADKYGTNYHWRSTATYTDSFFWTPNILAAGNYEVYAWWCVGSNRTTVAPYTIYYKSGNTTITVNQQINGGRWNSMGTYYFDTGTTGRVKLSCTAPTGFIVVADAVKFVRR